MHKLCLILLPKVRVMKKEKIVEKLNKYCKAKNYIRLTRNEGDITCGILLKKSNDFILLRESDEFRLLSYLVIPIATIKHVRYNKFDKTYERILKKEGLLDNLKSKYKIDLTNWKSICKDIKKTGLPIISECEHPDINSFCIGELKRVNKKSISIRYFDAEGFINKENTINEFVDITKISFDDHYANVFSKYLTKRK